MKGLSKDSVAQLTLGEEAEGQRIDNYLLRILKGVPKSHVYRILRSGEIRVNGRRAAPTVRLQIGDVVRVPPIRISDATQRPPAPAGSALTSRTLFEDAFMLVIDKPAGMAVHGGSGVAFGVIERLRVERPELKFLELVHRLDKETSGVLLLAKKRSALTALHEQIRAGRTGKRYLVLIKGDWRAPRQSVRLPLERHVLASGERRVSVSEDGKASHTNFRLMHRYGDFVLLEADLKTGRTHQIRVHLAHLGFPIAGDDKYGDFALNKELARVGLKRMFLHAARFDCLHPGSGEKLSLQAPLASELASYLTRLKQAVGLPTVA
ncbi:MAG: RluA family pseudouridine synthase [Betaproteobacteria bacterium]